MKFILLFLLITYSSSSCVEQCIPIPFERLSIDGSPVPNPTTPPTTLSPTTLPSISPSTSPTPGVFFSEDFGSCTLDGLTLTCISSSWSGSNLGSGGSHVDTSPSDGLLLARNARITLILDISSVSEISNVKLTVGTVGDFESSDYCNLVTMIQPAFPIAHTGFQTLTRGIDNLPLTEYNTGPIGGGSQLVLQITGFTNALDEQCKLGTIILE
jgi:hypothetical protein